MCDDETAGTAPQSRVIRLPPRPPAFAEGEVFPVAEYSLLMNPERYGLPPVDGPWRYYQVEFEVFRVDNATQRGVLERMRAAMAPHGLLFAGHSENFTDSKDLFRLRGKTVYERV